MPFYFRFPYIQTLNFEEEHEVKTNSIQLSETHIFTH